MSLRALQRRVEKLEVTRKPRPSPFTIWFGSMDAFVDSFLVPGIQNGLFDPFEMIDIVAALRNWDDKALWSEGD